MSTVSIETQNISSIQLWVHCVTNRVVSDYFFVLESPNPEVLRQGFKAMIMSPEVLNWLLVHRLHKESLDDWTDIKDFVFLKSADGAHSFCFLFKVGYDKRVSYSLSHV